MISTYSTQESAIEAIPDFCCENEQDVFIYKVIYPSGSQFRLLLRDEVMDENSVNIVYKYYLPIEYHFKNRDNAYRESEIWSDRLSMLVEVNRHYKTKNNYKILSYYTLKI